MKNKILIILMIILIFIVTLIGISIYSNKSNVDSEGVPYIYIEGHNQKVKTVRYDEYKEIFDELFSADNNEEKYYSINDFYTIFEKNSNSILQYSSEDISYFDLYSSNETQFSIEGIMTLSCRKDAIAMSVSGASKEAIFKDKEFGKLIEVGFTKSPTDEKLNNDVIKVFKINFEQYGIHYYSVIVNKSDMNEENVNEMEKIHKRKVMINNKLYYDTGKETDIKEKGEAIDGKITSNVSEDEVPTQNNQSNFSGNYEYKIPNENFVIINIDNKMCVFALE